MARRKRRHFTDEFKADAVDLRREGWDLALRAGTHLEPGLVARTLARAPMIAVATPGYLAARGTPRRRSDLRRHTLLVAYGRDGLPQTHWPARSGLLRVEGGFFSNHMYMLTAAARAGLGIALLPALYVRDALDDGTLVAVLPGNLEAEGQVAIVYAERDYLPNHVRAFIDALVAWAPTEFEGTDVRVPRSPRRRAATR